MLCRLINVTNFIGTDINECESNDMCGKDATCVNTQGGFECQCLPGYQRDPVLGCTDINECLRDNACAPNAKCINIYGSYKCVCPQGFTGHGLILCESQ